MIAQPLATTGNAPPGNQFDAIVVGAGLNGSWVANELTRGGMKVALVDAGPILSEAEFSPERFKVNVFDLKYHLFRIKLLLKGDTDRAFAKFLTSQTSRLFLDRRRDPYQTPPAHDFSWMRVRAVGGRGHFWGRVMLRFNDRQLADSGFGWPIRYDDLAPYYDEVEELLEMGGAPSQTAEVPDGRYIQERSLHPLEGQFRESVRRRWPDRPVVVNHVAGYAPAPLSPMLSAANETDRLFLQPNKVVAALATGVNGAVVGVTTVCTKSRAVETIRAPYVVLSASAFESVRILLNSKCEKFPAGLGNSNGLLGTRILEHMADGFLAALPTSIRSEKPRYYHNPFKLNAEPHGFYIPSLVPAERSGSGYPFGYGVQGTISTDTGIFYLAGFGETVPSDSNRIRLIDSTKDRFGVPVPSVEFSWAAEDIAMWKDMRRVLAEMTEAFCIDSGIKLDHPLADRARAILAGNAPPVPGSNHECGGARMGVDPATSVLDPYNRLWDAPNVLVCDTACFPSIPHQNPTLTSMALAVRASRKLLATANSKP
jgi:choline dehydrogenase-like flavoprotein